MIIFFGPAGSGKSVQGQLLAARHDWRWLSAGQLLRDTHDSELLRQMATGGLVDHDKVNQIMAAALTRAQNIKRVILDGYPRELVQAKWLVESQPEHGRAIGLVIILEVPSAELLRRLELRGRLDDSAESIDKRLEIYRREINPILDYFATQQIPIARVDGTGTVGQVHDRIEAEVVACSLV